MSYIINIEFDGKMAANRKVTQRQQWILSVIQGYSYNAYEVCRILNGNERLDFVPCFHNRMELSDRCRKKTRGCNIRSQSVDKDLRSLWKKGLIKSIKLRWFDSGRAKNGLCTDNFRFYYIEKRHLAARLKDDIERLLEND